MTDDRVVLISYPSGGFGNFIFHALTTHADNTFKADNKFKFSLNGNSHSTKKYTAVYKNFQQYTLIKPDPTKITLVLCDNGINDDSYTQIRNVFPTAEIVRLCIDESVRPVVYQTCIIKAQQSNLLSATDSHVNNNWSDAHEDYARRENFTLLYHNWPFNWNNSIDAINISIEQLIVDPVSTITNLIHSINCNVINLDDLISLCNKWKLANEKYFQIYYDWLKIEQALDNNESINISDISDIHNQGYINYCIEKKFNITIPVYNYKDWFKNTNDIKQLCEKNNINN